MHYRCEVIHTNPYSSQHNLFFCVCFIHLELRVTFFVWLESTHSSVCPSTHVQLIDYLCLRAARPDFLREFIAGYGKVAAISGGRSGAAVGEAAGGERSLSLLPNFAFAQVWEMGQYMPLLHVWT